jgi:hypothetical protein
MPSPKVGVTPYLYGNLLHMAVEVNGVEYNFEADIRTLLKITSECLDPYQVEQENEAYALIEALEDGMRYINDAVGADEGAIQYE